ARDPAGAAPRRRGRRSGYFGGMIAREKLLLPPMGPGTRSEMTSRRARSRLGLVACAVAALAVGAAVGCGGSGATPPSWTPPAQQPCTGADGCHGQRTCEGTPLVFGACRCEAAPDGGATDASPEAGAGPVLGASCDRDADCPSGALCLRAEGDGMRLF